MMTKIVLAALLGLALVHNAIGGHWFENMLMYQVYPRSFQDTNGDGVGDIKGIITRLSYLKESGVDSIWLSPVLKSPQKDNGYDISDFKDVDSLFGTRADLIELMQKAKEMGMKIIMDFVPNHTSNEHEWFIKSENNDPEYRDFFIWRAGKNGQRVPPNNWQSCFYGPAWTWSEKRQMYYLHQFAKEQPDLDYRNPKVKAAMLDVIGYWLENGADGFRIDAINHMFEVEDLRDEPLSGHTNDPNDYGYTHHIHTKDLQETYDTVQEWRRFMDNWASSRGLEPRVLITEAYANLSSTLAYYQSKDGEPIAHFPFNFQLIENLHGGSNAFEFKETIDAFMYNMPAGSIANWVLGNHDKPRVGSRFGWELIDGLMALVMTLPGVAITYNGEEIGMVDFRDISWEDTRDPQACNTNPNEYKWRSRDPQRTPYQWDGSTNAGFSTGKPWIPMHPNYSWSNLATQKSDARSHYKLWKTLSMLRKEPSFKTGEFRSVALNYHTLGYVRSQAGNPSYVVIINLFGNSEVINANNVIQFTGDAVVVAAGSQSRYNIGDKLSAASIQLDGFEILILRA